MKAKIEVWAKRLDEVGMPIETRAMNIEAIEKEIAQLKARATKERASLNKRVRELWSPVDIAKAKAAVEYERKFGGEGKVK